jgi:hypothetical protein
MEQGDGLKIDLSDHSLPKSNRAFVDAESGGKVLLRHSGERSRRAQLEACYEIVRSMSHHVSPLRCAATAACNPPFCIKRDRRDRRDICPGLSRRNRVGKRDGRDNML